MQTGHWLALVALCSVAPLNAAERPSAAALARAAQAAHLEQIDDFRKQCGDERTVAAWLKEVLGDTAAAVKWSGGKCRLVNKQNPLDAGSGFCGHADITPKSDTHEAAIEVFFERSQHGKAGAPFAFRATMFTKDGWDYMRETYAFEVNWKQKYWPNYEPPANQDCD